MKAVLQFSIVLLIFSVTACKKDPEFSIPEVEKIDTLNQSIFYRTFATIPSPADNAKGIFKDSVFASRTVSRNSDSFLKNIDFVRADRSFAGLSLSYWDPVKSLPYFQFTANCFPGVQGNFQLNRLYTNSTLPGTMKPLFLGAHNGFDGMTFFVDNIFPPDAEFPALTKTYTSVMFNKKIKVNLSYGDSAIYVSGRISGYAIDYYNKIDTTKYLHRWDFTVDFTDLRLFQ